MVFEWGVLRWRDRVRCIHSFAKRLVGARERRSLGEEDPLVPGRNVGETRVFRLSAARGGAFGGGPMCG